MFGTQEPDAYFYGERSRRSARPSTGSTRAASRPASSRRPDGRSRRARRTLTRRRVRHPQERRAEREGRAAVLPAHHLLPDATKATGPPGSSSRSTATRSSAGPSLSRTPSSGRSTAAPTRSSTTTGSAARGNGVGAEYRYIAAPGSQGNLRTYLLDQNATTYNREQRHDGLPAGAEQLRTPRLGRAEPAGRPAGARQRRLLLGRHGPADCTTRTCTTPRAASAPTAATSSGTWGAWNS